MRRFTKVLAFIMLITAMMVAASCKPDENNDSDVRVTTYTPQDITQTTAVCGGDVIVTQGLSLNELGICWSKERNPTVEDTLVSTTNWRDTFVRTITGLEPATKYYVRAFALRGLQYCYGEEKSFTTLGGELPTVTTTEVSNITTNSATFGGEVVSDGGLAVTERGVCWGVNPYPTIDDEHSGVGLGSGLFSMNAHGLEQNTTYYVRAYAINYYGVGYGSQVSFTTQKEELPIVTTFDITNITTHSAASGGEVISEGGLPVVERGICWSLYPNPTINDAHNSSGSGLGSFSASMFGLEQSTTYHVRAYATNSVGTGYGEDKEFTTLMGGGNGSVPAGAIDGLFSVSPTNKVYFSQGNLQYQASTNTWRFASNQWDYVGDANSNISQNYTGWIDLFGWGTSGYNHGAVCYQPWNSNKGYDEYYAYGDPYADLFEQSGLADWGNNVIINGGNTSYQWRTLTYDEWNYVLFSRNTASGINYAKANVNGTNGVIVLPDDWTPMVYSLNNTNDGSADYSGNTLTISQWSVLEQSGAVFLPSAGYRYGTLLYSVNSHGNYWSTNHSTTSNAHYLYFLENIVSTREDVRWAGRSVRLVQEL